jgi:hypothetical protein
MNKQAESHLTKAKEYVERGEQFYRMAAEQIMAARSEGATWPEINEGLGRGDEYAERIAKWIKTPANTAASTPFSEPKGEVAKRHARSVLREADEATMDQLVSELPAKQQERIAQATHKAQVNRIRASTESTPEAVTSDDYETIREKFGEIRDASTIEMQELFTALSRVRVKGIERLVANTTASERRQWVERLPDEIALLQLALDLCRTHKLEAVR